jgi:hypothetical protein
LRIRSSIRSIPIDCRCASIVSRASCACWSLSSTNINARRNARRCGSSTRSPYTASEFARLILQCP